MDVRLPSNVQCCHCGSEEGLKSCARCRSVYYCSTDCQRASWKSHHKEDCPKIQEKEFGMNGDQDILSQWGALHPEIQSCDGSQEKVDELIHRLKFSLNDQQNFCFYLFSQGHASVARSCLKRVAQNYPPAALNLCSMYLGGFWGEKVQAKIALKLLNSCPETMQPEPLPPGAHWVKDIPLETVYEIGRWSTLGTWYFRGIATHRNLERAAYCYQKGADLGDDNSKNCVGALFLKGCIPDVNGTAKNSLFEAAENGDAFAQCNVASLYHLGKGVPQDDKKAYFWWKKSADQGCAPAENCVGVCYEQGDGGVQVDEAKAVYYFRKSAQKGFPQAMVNLCHYLLPGDQFSNPKECAKWYKKAEKLDFPAGLGEIGISYLDGDLVPYLPHDPQRGIACLERAVKLGDADAMSRYGVRLVTGNGVPQNKSRAFAMFLQGAELNHGYCLQSVGNCYMNGDGVARDVAKAYTYHYRAATEHENLRSMYNLGVMNLNADGVPKNVEEGLKWLEKSTSLGWEKSCQVLMMIYAKGKYGIPANAVKSALYYTKFMDITAKNARDPRPDVRTRAQHGLANIFNPHSLPPATHG